MAVEIHVAYPLPGLPAVRQPENSLHLPCKMSDKHSRDSENHVKPGGSARALLCNEGAVREARRRCNSDYGDRLRRLLRQRLQSERRHHPLGTRPCGRRQSINPLRALISQTRTAVAGRRTLVTRQWGRRSPPRTSTPRSSGGRRCKKSQARCRAHNCSRTCCSTHWDP